MDLGNIIGTVSSAKEAIPQPIKEYVSEFVDEKFKDPKLIENIEQKLCEQYGEYVFYNDLTKFLSRHRVIKNTIEMFNNFGKGSLDLTSQEHFCSEQIAQFKTEYPSYTSLDTQDISKAFQLIYSEAFQNKLILPAHTDGGTLQRDMATFKDQEAFHHNENLSEFSKIETQLSTLLAISSKDTREEVGESSKKVNSFLKEIDDTDSQNLDDNAALQVYQKLLGRVSIELIDEPKNQVLSVICSIECHIAIHQSNIGEIDAAFDSLEKINDTVRETSKLYNYVKATLIANHGIEEKYSEAQANILKALEIDSEYHSAYFVQEYLFALQKVKSFTDLISDMEEYFANIQGSKNSDALFANYYMYYGFICKEFEKFDEAKNAFLNAIKYGYDSNVANYNIGLLYYSQATRDFSKAGRVFCPKVNCSLLVKVVRLFQDKLIVDSTKIPQYLLINMIGIYVSSCCLLGIKHQLSVEKYLSLSGISYEVLRMIILGTDSIIKEEWLEKLDKEDQLQAKLFNYQKSGDINKIKDTFASIKDDEVSKFSMPILHMFLQACIILQDFDTYSEYRKYVVEDSDAIQCMDAYYLEGVGEKQKAKEIIDQYAKSSNDYSLLTNIMRFYLRNDLLEDCQKATERIFDLLSSRKIIINDKIELYTSIIPYFVKHKSPFADYLINALNSDGFNDEQSWRLKAYYYEAICDMSKLTECYEILYNITKDFNFGYNHIISLIKCMKYNQALDEAQQLLTTIHENNIIDQTKIIWIISDIYLFIDKQNESYEWAKKAHELNIANPQDESHLKLLGRGTITGHIDESLSIALEFKNTHPVVTGQWIKEVKLPEKASANTLKNMIDEVSGQSFDDYEQQEREVASLYKSGLCPNASLLRHYNYDLAQFFSFASKKKLLISDGNAEILHRQRNTIKDEIIIDALTLIVLFHYNCEEVLKCIPKIHVCFSSISILQGYIPTINFGYVKNILDWIGSSSNVVLESDGYKIDTKMPELFNYDFLPCCENSIISGIPFISIETQGTNVFNCFVENEKPCPCIVSPISLIHRLSDKHPKVYNKSIYNLLKECCFVNFTYDTIIDIIDKEEYLIDSNKLDRFFFCNSSCDMLSFARVYVSTIKFLLTNNSTAAEEFAVLVLSNAETIWRRGTHYRMMYEEYGDADSRKRSDMIKKYEINLLFEIKSIFEELPSSVKQIYDAIFGAVVRQIGHEYLNDFTKGISNHQFYKQY